MELKIGISNAQNIDGNRCVLSGRATFFLRPVLCEPMALWIVND